MAISLDQFVDENFGKILANPDGSYLGECVSLVQQYLYQCLDIPFEPRGNAKEWLTNEKALAIATIVSGLPKSGDIIVYPTKAAPSGHIGVAISSTQTFEQNVDSAPSYKTAFIRNLSDATKNGDTYVIMRPNKLLDENPPQPTNPTGVYLVAKNGSFNIRETAGTGLVKTTVPKGSEAQILEFGSVFITASDGKKYQWAKTKYNNVIGYSQLDLHNDYLIRKESTSSKIYLRAVVGGFRVRNAPVVGNELTFVPQNGKAEILYTNVNFESDGFQWPRVTYNGTSGFSQMDTVGYYRLEF